MTLLEICLDDVDGAPVAEAAGADRLELCAAIGEGGITPSLGTVAAVFDRVRHVGVQVLVRQRPGDFVYSDAELDAMAADIRAIRALPRPEGVKLGFVVGALTPDGTIDRSATERLVAAARDVPVTFHKAFDQCPDQFAALDRLIDLGCERVLTSGGAVSAIEGSAQLAELVAHASGRIAVLAGGGVRPDHVGELVRTTGVGEVHLRAGASVPSAALAGTNEVSPTARSYDPGHRIATSRELVARMRAALDTATATA
ncbi:copper homeostasis protein CutC [Agromyces sp. SYSU K20354]|uniref:copper homeostasis protein CutC n=1 Tax=Agromyces cavernae TaxID=2898659 RepID=UPI001E5FD98A|nr:copper homeostasis protein CutC [Agromyces cavernae]MCD2443842.1 copper homeostasis protein CutC [Agromyces cavernae]